MLTLRTRPRPLLLGNDLETGETVRIRRELLSTHFHVMGPPGTGKTRLLLRLFRSLCADPDASVVLFNVKGELGRMARDWAIADRHTKRLVILDPAESERVIGYNPLRPNGLSVATHAKAVREAIRAGWGQASLDQTPQLARLLFLALAVVRELGLTLVEAVRLLQPGSSVRRSALRQLHEGHLREALAYFDSLRDTRQEELAASTLARLEAFVNDEHVRRILTQQARSMDLGRIVADHRVLIVNLEQYRPLRLDDVKLLGRMIINDLLAHVFARPRQARTPVYLIIDEVEVFATNDLCSALDQGRELGLHCILAHQHYEQLREEDGSGRLLSSVKNCARIKVVFGGLSIEDLEPIAKEFSIDGYDPMAVKNEIDQLELEPVESRRLVASVTLGGGRNWSEGTSEQEGSGHAVGESRATAESDSVGHGSGLLDNFGSSMAMLPNGEMIDSSFAGGGTSESSSQAHTTMHSRGEQEAWNTFEAQGTSRSAGGNVNAGISLTLTPFYEYRKRRVVSSREFWKLDEFLIKPLQRLHTLPRGCFALKVPGVPALFLRAPRIEEPWLTVSKRAEALAQVFSQPFYAAPDEIAKEEATRNERFALARRRRASTIKALPSHDEAADGKSPGVRRIPKPPTDAY
jgi:hypothetical protein